MTKRCSKCGEVRGVDAFGKNRCRHGGLQSYCRDCQREYRRENAERAAAYQVEYHKDPLKRAAKNARTKKSQALYPERVRARAAVRNAIQAGKVVRLQCESCGNTPADAHHDDYSKPFVVRWLCRQCHGAHHAKARTEKLGVAGA